MAYYLATTKDDMKYRYRLCTCIFKRREGKLNYKVFDSDHPKGYLAGANFDYTDTDVGHCLKNITEIKNGIR